MTVQLLTFPDRQTMTRALALRIAGILHRAVTKRGKATFIASGGGTPRPVYEELSQQVLDWSKVRVSLADERWVAPESPDSNEYLLHDCLLKGHARSATFVPLKTVHPTPEAGRDACEAALAQLPSPYDAVLLGMGDDGHTASLFPQADALPAALDMHSGRSVLALTPKVLPEHAPYARMTMTLPRLLKSRLLILLLSGSSKWQVYQEALLQGEVGKMPVRAILRQSAVPVAVYWAP